MRVLLAREKHGDRHFDATTDTLLENACRLLILERIAEGVYDPYVTIIARQALGQLGERARGMPVAYDFLLTRRGAEYEFVTLLHPHAVREPNEQERA